MRKIISTLLMTGLVFSSNAFCQSRFFLSGDGVVVLNGRTISFRNGQEDYDEAGLKKINALFGARWTPEEERLDLRFIEVLDYVQDQLKGGSYFLKSGYRSPASNQSLRNRGQLAAQSSMHMEGAAGDLKLEGVEPSAVFAFVKGLDCCGVGYYHSGSFHLDAGPSRYWDEKTSKTEDKTPQENEKIILQPDYDRYQPSERITLKFMRVTHYPIGIPQSVQLISLEDPKKIYELKWFSSKLNAAAGECLTLPDRPSARRMEAVLPGKGMPAGAYAVQVKFCNRYDYSKMPEEIRSRRFEIR